MSGDISKPSLTPVDVRCGLPGCTCEKSVPGNIVKDGYAVDQAAGQSCPACGHPWDDHEILGLSKGPIGTGEALV
jgi:hypothetical protein